jgi:hypothetical protein
MRARAAPAKERQPRPQKKWYNDNYSPQKIEEAPVQKSNYLGDSSDSEDVSIELD